MLMLFSSDTEQPVQAWAWSQTTGVPPTTAWASGARSAHAAKILRDAGFSPVRNLTGGIRRWAQEGLPVER